MSEKNTNTLENRDGFNTRWGFILACIGSAVGMGNIWRFPIMVSTYGGMTFLIPYFIFLRRDGGIRTGPLGGGRPCGRLR